MVRWTSSIALQVTEDTELGTPHEERWPLSHAGQPTQEDSKIHDIRVQLARRSQSRPNLLL